MNYNKLLKLASTYQKHAGFFGKEKHENMLERENRELLKIFKTQFDDLRLKGIIPPDVNLRDTVFYWLNKQAFSPETNIALLTNKKLKEITNSTADLIKYLKYKFELDNYWPEGVQPQEVTEDDIEVVANRFSNILNKKSQMLAPGESTMGHNEVMSNLAKLNQAIDYLSSVDNSALQIMFKNDAELLKNFVESALDGDDVRNEKENAKAALVRMKSILANQIDVASALKAIDYYGVNI